MTVVLYTKSSTSMRVPYGFENRFLLPTHVVIQGLRRRANYRCDIRTFHCNVVQGHSHPFKPILPPFPLLFVLSSYHVFIFCASHSIYHQCLKSATSNLISMYDVCLFQKEVCPPKIGRVILRYVFMHGCNLLSNILNCRTLGSYPVRMLSTSRWLSLVLRREPPLLA